MSLDPKDWTAFRADAHLFLDDMIDHLSGVREAPLWRDPSDAAATLAAPLPRGPTDLAEVYESFKSDILPYGSGNIHPGFMGWVQGAGTPVGMLAEMLSAAMNLNCGGRHHIGIAVEQQIARWMAQLFRFPATATGLFLTGASQANFIAVCLARTRALGAGIRAEGLRGQDKSLVAYASREAHGCIPRAMELAGLGTNQLRLIDVDADFRIDIDALLAAIEADKRAGNTPFLLVGSAGTVNVGSIDELDALAAVAARYDLTYHIDGALGALSMMSQDLKHLMNGIERCDSLAFDFHKWGHAPYDAGYLLVRDGDLQKATFASPAAYLTRSERGLAAGDWWPCDYGPDLSRGFRALKTWMTLKTYGADALASEMEGNCALARILAARIDAEPELERLAPVALNIVCFRYRHSDSDALNRAIVEDLHLAGRVAPSVTIVNGVVAIRAAIINHRTGQSDIDCLVDSTLALGRTLRGRPA